jgi:hypothetical protein
MRTQLLLEGESAIDSLGPWDARCSGTSGLRVEVAFETEVSGEEDRTRTGALVLVTSPQDAFAPR